MRMVPGSLPRGRSLAVVVASLGFFAGLVVFEALTFVGVLCCKFANRACADDLTAPALRPLPATPEHPFITTRNPA